MGFISTGKPGVSWSVETCAQRLWCLKELVKQKAREAQLEETRRQQQLQEAEEAAHPHSDPNAACDNLVQRNLERAATIDWGAYLNIGVFTFYSVSSYCLAVGSSAATSAGAGFAVAAIATLTSFIFMEGFINPLLGDFNDAISWRTAESERLRNEDW